MLKLYQKWESMFWGRVLLMLFLAVNICLLNDAFYYPQMPEIVFVRDKYDLQGKPCEITFIDKYGKSYYSDDPYVCKISYGDLINAYKSGTIEDKITSRGSCSRNEVVKRYRQIYRNVDRIKTLLYLGYTTQQSLPRWDWGALYFDESGEIQYVNLHSNYPGYEEKTNYKQADQIYEWCKDTMGQPKD